MLPQLYIIFLLPRSLAWPGSLWGATLLLLLPLSASEVMSSPMAGAAIREVLSPASPFVARTPLATGRLPASDCCMLRPGHAHAGPRGTHVPISVPLHVRARAIRLFLRSDTLGGQLPARRALRYTLIDGPRRRAGGNDMTSRRRSPRFSSGTPPRDPPRPSQFGYDRQF